MNQQEHTFRKRQNKRANAFLVLTLLLVATMIVLAITLLLLYHFWTRKPGIVVKVTPVEVTKNTNFDSDPLYRRLPSNTLPGYLKKIVSYKQKHEVLASADNQSFDSIISAPEGVYRFSEQLYLANTKIKHLTGCAVGIISDSYGNNALKIDVKDKFVPLTSSEQIKLTGNPASTKGEENTLLIPGSALIIDPGNQVLFSALILIKGPDNQAHQITFLYYALKNALVLAEDTGVEDLALELISLQDLFHENFQQHVLVTLAAIQDFFNDSKSNSLKRVMLVEEDQNVYEKYKRCLDSINGVSVTKHVNADNGFITSLSTDNNNTS